MISNSQHAQEYNNYVEDNPRITDFKPGTLVKIMPWSGACCGHEADVGMILHGPDRAGRFCILFGESKKTLNWTILLLVVK